MSDTSVADQGDQPDTNAGEDTPPPPSSSSAPAQRQGPAARTWQPPPGLPGPLQALVGQLFQGRQPGPLPQPRVAPPFDQLQAKAQQREAPYARPTGAYPPYKTSPVQTYVPSLPTRSAHEWGTGGDYPNTPATWELPGLFQGVGNKLAQIGSGNINPIAGLLGGGAYQKSYIAGQMARVKFDHERMVNAANELDIAQTEELKRARDAYALFGGDVTTMQGADESVKLPNVGNLHDALTKIATESNDEYLLAALNSGAGGLKRAENILKERDAASKDLKAGLTQQRKDQERRDAESPYLEDGGPSQAGPPIGKTEPPADVNPDASVPSETPEPAPGGPPGEQPTQPAPSPDKPGPDTTAPDFDPAEVAPQAQAQPQRPRGVQVAEAGASDAPQVGINQVAPQDDTMGWQPSQSVLGNAQNEDGAKYNIPSMDQLARKSINNPLYKPTARGVYPGTTSNMTGWITRRGQQIESDLTRIEQDPRFDPKPGDTDQVKRQKRAGAWRAINKVDPELAQAMLGYVQGDNPVPMSQQFANQRAHIIALGQKIDPTFNANTYANRANIRRDMTVGIDGRTMAGIATANAHVKRAMELAAQLKEIQTPGLGPFLTQKQQEWQAGAPDALGGDKRVRELRNAFNYEISLIAPEVMRAQKGAAPTQGEVNDFQHLMDASQPADELIGRLNNATDLFHQRMNQMVQRFTIMSGGKPDTAMMTWFGEFERQGFKFEPPIGQDAVQGDLPPLLGGGSVSDAIKGFMNERPSGGPPAPSTMNQEDSDALNWARSNPNDPRAKKILQHLGQ